MHPEEAAISATAPVSEVHTHQKYPSSRGAAQHQRADGRDKTLTAGDLRSIRNYIGINQNLTHSHRRGQLTDHIPSLGNSPFHTDMARVLAKQSVDGPTDSADKLEIAPIPSKRCSINYMLRLVPPFQFRTPFIVDPQANDGLMDITDILSATKHMAMAPHKGKGLSASAAEVHESEKLQTQSRQAQTGTLGSTGAFRTRAAPPSMGIKDYEMRALSCRRGNRPVEEAIAHFNSGCLHYSRADFDKAIKAMKLALPLFERTQQRVNLSLVHNFLGLLHYHSNDLKESLKHHQHHESVASSHTGKAVALVNQGVAHAGMEDQRRASLCFEAALTCATEEEDSMLQSLSYGNLGLAQMKNGQLKQATGNLEACLELCSLGGDGPASAMCLLLLGETYSRAKDFKRASFFFENALRISKDEDLRHIVEIARVNLGVARGNSDYRERLAQQQ